MSFNRFCIQAIYGRWGQAKKLAEQLDGVIYVDFCREPTKAFCGSLMTFGGKSHVHLEDDTNLCKGFKEHVRKAIHKHPDQVINFFNGMTKNPVREVAEKPGSTYLWAQCTYFPDWFASEFIEWCLDNDYHPDPKSRWSGLDESVAEFLKQTGRKYILWYPALVQHSIGVSAIDSRRPRRRVSVAFADDVK